jgi:hypothetical protein
MARLFDDARTQYLEWSGATPPVTAPPFTLACWACTDSDSADQALLWIGDKDSPTSCIGVIEMLAASPFPRVCARTISGGIVGSAVTGNYAVNTWHHVCGVFLATADRTVYLDGTNKGADATGVSGAGANTLAVGCCGDQTPSDYLSGAVAEAAIWSAALSQAEANSLARGFLPVQIRPESLVAYWPLGGFFGQVDRDLLGQYDMTAHNTPSWTAHPPLIYPTRPRVAVPTVPVASKMPWHLFDGRAA